MEKRWKCSIFFLLFVSLCVITNKAFCDINYEIVTGGTVSKVVSLFEPEGSDNFIGTVELRGKTIVRCDVNGVIIAQAAVALSGVGEIKPIYNASGAITNFNVLSGAGTTKNGIINFNANLASPVVKSSWSSPILGEILYPAGSVRLGDGSSMNVSYNNTHVYLMKTDVNHLPLWTEAKTLDMSGLSDWTVPSIGDLSVEVTDDDNIIIGMTGRGDGGQNYDNIFFSVNSNGVNNYPPVRFDFGNLEDMLGDFAVDGNGIHILSSGSGSGIDVAYYLNLGYDLGQQSFYEFADPNVVPFDISINPDGMIYVAGGYGYYSGTGNGDGLFGWVNSHSPDQYEWFIQDFGGTIDGSFKTVDWTPAGAIFGGSDHAGNAWRGVYTADTPPAVPEPGTILLFGTGLLFFARTCRRRN